MLLLVRTITFTIVLEYLLDDRNSNKHSMVLDYHLVPCEVSELLFNFFVWYSLAANLQISSTFARLIGYGDTPKDRASTRSPRNTINHDTAHLMTKSFGENRDTAVINESTLMVTHSQLPYRKPLMSIMSKPSVRGHDTGGTGGMNSDGLEPPGSNSGKTNFDE